jgi:hypothetical protein
MKPAPVKHLSERGRIQSGSLEAIKESRSHGGFTHLIHIPPIVGVRLYPTQNANDTPQTVRKPLNKPLK